MNNNRICFENHDGIALSGTQSINRITNTVLFILWVGTILLTAFMIYRWQDGNATEDKPKNARGYFIDDMLLSSGDLELKNTSSLINITLNTDKPFNSAPAKNDFKATHISQNESSRKILYDKILRQKLKKSQTKYSDGFSIQPLPE